ncbi:MAG: 50S ribosomal protein L9, partial [Cytophagales bacterium CG17_big_fil_post_rev_8_21_14_2_50_40_13]
MLIHFGIAVLEIKTEAGDSGRIFEAVTTLQISDALKASSDIDVDRKKISFKGEVKNVGEYEAEIDLHKLVKKDVKFIVVA